MALNRGKLITYQAGVSLIEFIIGLVLLAIILLGSTLFFASQQQQLDPVFQFRAVALAEALAEQMLAVKYDANNNPFEQIRCGIKDAPACSYEREPSHLSLADFTQLDDFNLWCADAMNGASLAEQLGLDKSELYQRFTVETCITASETSTPVYKKVAIKIAMAGGADLTLTMRRYNIR
ncbi:prepilin-type cleavage/methylation-like protein [Oceanisphaera avium]|uniref:Prepilin-type cleavage/methylation-like protein n=1 Tax=Oceanisphaera avium TaxID=1903694 RepID=A0A1Y0CVK5_9GAMM|nr:prepilin-type cleavage/methylation-like protein [Oceanisphaera avium]ART79248.1 prepilin-type cleavage/methylation-like protein [Oceanisphaera avium]